MHVIERHRETHRTSMLEGKFMIVGDKQLEGNSTIKGQKMSTIISQICMPLIVWGY